MFIWSEDWLRAAREKDARAKERERAAKEAAKQAAEQTTTVPDPVIT
jgi:hypothetical protein